MKDDEPIRQALRNIRESAWSELERSRSEAELQTLRIQYLGRKGQLTQVLRDIGRLSPEARPLLGKEANELKAALERAIEKAMAEARGREKEQQLLSERVDCTLPGRMPIRGSKHLITQVMGQIVSIFERLGFEVAEGPEVELDYYNFEALNFPKDHPARDMQDTFYFSSNVVLRTHTSPVQIRTMESRRPPPCGSSLLGGSIVTIPIPPIAPCFIKSKVLSSIIV